MHKNNFVVSVKSNGKILREKEDKVFLPFGSEYSLLIKNLDSRKAKVRIHIDSQDILNGSSLIAYPNRYFEIEGFLDGLKARNRFKFIKKTQEISDHRGDRLDDGLIRVEFTFEKEIKTSINYSYNYYQPRYGRRGSDYNPITLYSSNNISNNVSSTLSENFCGTATANCEDSFNSRNIQNDEGITVKGSEINQQFQYADIGELEETANVIILSLKGTKNGNVSIPLTTKTKLICKTCGKSFNSNAKYCSNCGTFLEIP